jgi:hypothetical protein
MSNSKRSKEGYLMIDHRATEGVADEIMVKDGLPVGAGRGLFETPTYTCSHCMHVVVMNPLRTRDREYCRGCDSYICDGCGYLKKQGKSCKTHAQAADEYLTAVERGTSLILPS